MGSNNTVFDKDYEEIFESGNAIVFAQSKNY